MTLPCRPMLFLHQPAPTPRGWWPWLKWVARTAWRDGWGAVWFPSAGRLADSIRVHLEQSADGVTWETVGDATPRGLQRVSFGARTRYAPRRQETNPVDSRGKGNS